MAVVQNTIAVVFDFDDTLTDDTITGLVSDCKKDAVEFWKEVDELVRRGWDPPLAYMKRMADLAKNGGPLSKLTSQKLHNFGENLEFYPGVRELFDQLREFIVSNADYQKAGISIQYYVITGGLQDIVSASEIKGHLRDFWGSSFDFEPKRQVIQFPKNVMSFTEKTRCLFQINKGVVGLEYKGRLGEVNKPMRAAERPVPFSHMIYVGDGLTDMACLSILKRFGGVPIAVFDVEKLERDEYKARSWLLPWLLKRELPLFPAKYRRGDSVRIHLEGAIARICQRILR